MTNVLLIITFVLSEAAIILCIFMRQVGKEWLHNYENFYYWAIKNGYKKGLTIERINTNGNYERSNCKWATMTEQNRNRRNSIPQSVKEKVSELRNNKMTVSQISKELNRSYDIIKHILRKYPINLQANV